MLGKHISKLSRVGRCRGLGVPGELGGGGGGSRANGQGDPGHLVIYRNRPPERSVLELEAGEVTVFAAVKQISGQISVSFVVTMLSESMSV